MPGSLSHCGSETSFAVGGRENCPCAFSKPAGPDHTADGARDVGDDMQRLPFDFGKLLDRLRPRNFRGGDADEDVGAGRLQLDDVVIDRRARVGS